MIGRKTSLTIANLAVGAVLGLVAQKAVAFYLGPDPPGVVAYALGLMGLVYFVADLGMGQAHVKRVSEGRDPGDCFATFAVFKIAVTLLFVLLSLGLFFGYSVVLGRPLEDLTWSVVLLVILYYVAKSLQDIGQSSFEARLETARTQVVSFTDTLVRVLLTLLAVFLVATVVHRQGLPGGAMGAENPLVRWLVSNPAAALALAHAAGALAAATVSTVMLVRVLERGRFRWDLLKDYASFALPLFLATAIGMIAANVDSAAIGFFLGQTDAGVFRYARNIPFVLAGIGTAVSVLLFPTISALNARDDRLAVFDYMDKGIRYLSMLLTPIVAFLVFFSADVIRLALSDQFLSGTLVLSMLTLYFLLTTLAGPHANLLMGMGHSGVIARTGILTAVSIVVLDVVLIPADIRSLGIRLAGLGINGAALGTLVSGALWYGLLVFHTRRLAGYRQRARIGRHVLAALAMSALLLVFDQRLLPLVQWYHFLLYTVLGAGIYLAALILLKEFHKDDLRYLRDSIHPIEMLRYVAAELRTRRK